MNDSNPSLIQGITDAIARSPHQRITFAEFMEQVLYDSEHGYYAAKASQLGPWGDFVTSAHLSRDFGELLAIQFLDLWLALDQPESFTLVEMGAGQGLVITDVVRFIEANRDHWPKMAAFGATLSVRIVEKAPALVKAQKAYLKHIPAFRSPIEWTTLPELAATPICGCFFSNELLDAFPVHRLVIQEGQMQELYVGLHSHPSQGDSNPEGLFQEIIGPPSSGAIAAYFAAQDITLAGPTYSEGYTTEVNVALQDWVVQVSNALQRGFLLTVDYGYLGHRYYHPSRVEGTLQCYRQHRSHGNPYQAVGHQDLTAHVDFTALQQYGKAQGLSTLGFTQQGLFLMALGLGDRLTANNNPASGQSLQDILRRRDAIHALMNPMGLGGFKVLLQGKGLTETQKQHPFQGFEDPNRI